MKGKALWDILLVKVDKEKEKFINGLILIDNKQSGYLEGTVVMTGEGKMNSDGKILPMQIKAGDVILFPSFLKNEIEIEGEKYRVINQENVVFIK